MKLRLVPLLLVLAALAPSRASADPDASAPAAAAASPRERLAGAYTWVGGPREVAARDEAIDRATSSMFFAIKGMARSKLRERLVVASTARLAFPEGRITVALQSESVATSPDTGAAVPHASAQGSSSTLAQRLVDGKLTQRIDSSEGGSRTVVFSLSPDGKTLTASHTVESSRLPQPVRYTLTYRKN